MSTNIYEQILANIDADKRAWCKGEWTEFKDGKPVSRCLVEHVDLALGTAYVKPNGKQFISKNKKRWNRRAQVLAHLASLISGQTVEPVTYKPESIGRYRNPGVLESPTGRRWDYVEDEVVGFNDRENTTKAKVRALLRKAAKKYGED